LVVDNLKVVKSFQNNEGKMVRLIKLSKKKKPQIEFNGPSEADNCVEQVQR